MNIYTCVCLSVLVTTESSGHEISLLLLKYSRDLVDEKPEKSAKPTKNIVTRELNLKRKGVKNYFNVCIYVYDEPSIGSELVCFPRWSMLELFVPFFSFSLVLICFKFIENQ